MNIKIKTKINAYSNINYNLPLHIKYSSYPDGTDFTDNYIDGQCYLGIAVSQTPPVSKESYQWINLAFDIGTYYPDMIVGKAIGDEDGNNIKETYATKESVDNLKNEFEENKATKVYTYAQRSSSNKWVVEHNLNKYPSVTVVDSAGTVVLGDVTYDSLNKLTISFKGYFSGKAYLN